LTSIRKRRRIEGAYRIKNIRRPEHVVLGREFGHDKQSGRNGERLISGWGDFRNDMMDDEFDGFALDAGSWLAVAREHLIAAEELGKCLIKSGSAERIQAEGHTGRLGMMRGCMLLMAFALENALKGLIVARGGLSVTDAWKLSWPKQRGLRTGHELVPLLEQLSEYSVWAGKYSIPNKREHFSELARSRRKLNWPEDLRTAKALFSHIEQVVEGVRG
jgi:hypothetical protein